MNTIQDTLREMQEWEDISQLPPIRKWRKTIEEVNKLIRGLK